MGFNVPGASFNSNVWGVPPMFIGAPSTSAAQQTQINFAYNEPEYEVPLENTSIPPSRFPPGYKPHVTWAKFTPNNRQDSPLQKKNFQRNYIQNRQRNYTQRLRSNDLRNYLSSRKSHDSTYGSRRSQGKFYLIILTEGEL